MESNKFESFYSAKVKAGRRRTYFFDVRKTKGDDYYITLTESTRKFNEEGYDRHKIFLYKEDFNRFLEGFTEVVNHVKTELMPDYDYDEFAKRYEDDQQNSGQYTKQTTPPDTSTKDSDTDADNSTEEANPEADSEDDMSW